MSNTMVRIENYPKAFSEINSIFRFFPEEYINKIPLSFRDFLEQNMDNTYTINIENLEDLSTNQLLYETKVLLSLIYRSYICTPQERQLLEEKDLDEIKKFQERYSPENLFKDRRNEPIEPTSETSLVKVDEHQNWYKKLKNAVMAFFKKIIKR